MKTEKKIRAAVRNIRRWEHRQMVGHLSLGIILGGLIYALTQIIISLFDKWDA